MTPKRKLNLDELKATRVALRYYLSNFELPETADALEHKCDDLLKLDMRVSLTKLELQEENMTLVGQPNNCSALPSGQQESTTQNE